MATAEIVTVTEQAMTWPLRATALVIEDSVTYVQASEFLKDIKALRKEVDAAFDPIISKAHDAHKEACGQKKRAEAPLAEAEQIIKRGLVAWDDAQEQIRRAEERRLAELARQEAERQRIEEAAALEREAGASVDAQEAYYLRREAEALIETPIVTPPVFVPSSTPKVAGLSYREVWKFRVVQAAKVPREYLIVDEIKIGQIVRALKGETKIDGIEVYREKVASAGGR